MDTMKIIKIKTLNPYITCSICSGYLINPVTITECLHTFCKTCLIKYLEEEDACPTCHCVIHHSHALRYVKFDRTIRNIVNAIVPDLEKKEKDAENEFYRLQNISTSKEKVFTHNNDAQDNHASNNDSQDNDCRENDTQDDDTHDIDTRDNDTHDNDTRDNDTRDNDTHDNDTKDKNLYDTEADLYDYIFNDQMSVTLDCFPFDSLEPLKRKYVRVSSAATIMHIKKFIAKSVLNDIDKYTNIDILYNTQLVDDNQTLKLISDMRQRRNSSSICLKYRSSVNTQNGCHENSVNGK